MIIKDLNNDTYVHNDEVIVIGNISNHHRRHVFLLTFYGGSQQIQNNNSCTKCTELIILDRSDQCDHMSR